MSLPMIDPPESLKAQSCGNCYFRRSSGDSHKCQYAIQEINGYGYAVFPKVHPRDWCGNWQPMPLETINLRTGNA